MSFNRHEWTRQAWSVTRRQGDRVASVLAQCADADGRCWPSWNFIREQAGCSRATVGNWLRRLEDEGLLNSKQRGDGKTAIYTLTMAASDDSSPSQPSKSAVQVSSPAKGVGQSRSPGVQKSKSEVQPKNLDRELQLGNSNSDLSAATTNVSIELSQAAPANRPIAATPLESNPRALEPVQGSPLPERGFLGGLMGLVDDRKASGKLVERAHSDAWQRRAVLEPDSSWAGLRPPKDPESAGRMLDIASSRLKGSLWSLPPSATIGDVGRVVAAAVYCKTSEHTTADGSPPDLGWFAAQRNLQWALKDLERAIRDEEERREAEYREDPAFRRAREEQAARRVSREEAERRASELREDAADDDFVDPSRVAEFMQGLFGSKRTSEAPA